MRTLVRCLGVLLVLVGAGVARAPAQATNRIVFLHHSVGANWLADGLYDALAAKPFVAGVNEITYGTVVPPDPGRPHSLGATPGDLTDMEHWLRWFNDYLGAIRTNGCAAGFNQIVMFKSCFPNSDVWDNGTEPGDPFGDHTLANYKAVYRHAAGAGGAYTNGGAVYLPLGDVFAAHPDTLFIPVTAPPLHFAPDDATSDANAARARAFNDWLKTRWLAAYNAAHPGLNNVAVFDLFDGLAYAATRPDHPNRLKEAYGGAAGDSHPNAVGNARATLAFATGERNVLNTAWHRFQSGSANAAPAALGTTIGASNGANAGRLIDGVYGPAQYGYTLCGGAAGAPGAFTLDLRAVRTVTDMRILLWQPDTRTYGYRVRASADGVAWVTIADARQGGMRGWQDWKFGAGVSARYLRLIGTSCSAGNTFGVIEWEVYARPAASSTRLITLD